MERGWFLAYVGMAAFCVAGSAMSHSAHVAPGPIAPVASGITLLLGCFTILICTARVGVFEAQLIAVAMLGVVVEIVGVTTGVPFGRYHYTNAWAPTIGLTADSRFPLLLPLAWVMIVASSWCVVAVVKQIESWWRHAMLVGVVATLADMVMEPIAVGRLGYWRWVDGGPMPGGVPIWNSLGWFLVASMGGALLGAPKIVERETRFAAGVLFVHIGMLCAIGLMS